MSKPNLTNAMVNSAKLSIDDLEISVRAQNILTWTVRRLMPDEPWVNHTLGDICAHVGERDLLGTSGCGLLSIAEIVCELEFFGLELKGEKVRSGRSALDKKIAMIKAERGRSGTAEPDGEIAMSKYQPTPAMIEAVEELFRQIEWNALIDQIAELKRRIERLEAINKEYGSKP